MNYCWLLLPGRRGSAWKASQEKLAVSSETAGAMLGVVQHEVWLVRTQHPALPGAVAAPQGRRAAAAAAPPRGGRRSRNKESPAQPSPVGGGGRAGVLTAGGRAARAVPRDHDHVARARGRRGRRRQPPALGGRRRRRARRLGRRAAGRRRPGPRQGRWRARAAAAGPHDARVQAQEACGRCAPEHTLPYTRPAHAPRRARRPGPRRALGACRAVSP